MNLQKAAQTFITKKSVLFFYPDLHKNEKAEGFRLLLLAAGEGFEPSQTESESVVLPLHKPAISLRSRNRQKLL